MNKYLKDLEKELKKLKVKTEEIKEIIEDHKEMIEAAKNEGLDEAQIEEKFGNPEKLAKELSESTISENEKMDYNFEDVNSCVKENTEDYNLVKAFPVVLEEISINVGLVSDDLALTVYDGESIQVFERDVEDINDYTISFENNELILKKDKKKIKIFSFSRKSSRFLVLVPQSATIKSLDYKTVSGDVELNGLKTSEFNMKSTSGDVEMSNIDAGKAKCTSVSGDMEIKNLKAKSFDVSHVSGDLEIEKSVIEDNMYFNSVSGDVELFEVECNVATFKTVSGDLEGKEFYPKEVSLKSVSGDIEIKNRDVLKEVNVISKKTVSGDININ